MKNYNSLITKQKSCFRTETTKDVLYRLDALQKLRNAI
ncbi:hypothetical protein BABA_20071 [Neobacillus bataviensis LMG 21833]|uniref:Uncharacterized protein n=1 Tax=Neobacillus bataviensis LMG 21833 TaxID=1117379 RepID=K6DX88_9BACI|nr:hypothetical protein BABA_20071 [Neobacillus bataviensis LMG 21833]